MTTSPPTPTVSVAPCSNDDMSACFTAMSRGFANDAPFFSTYFPDHDTGAGAKLGTQRLQAWKDAEPESTFLKAVLDSPSGDEKIVGFAVWTHMKTAPSPSIDELEDVAAIWPDDEDAEYMRRLWRKYVVPRSEAVVGSGGDGVYVLEILAVNKAYHRQGAGTALVRWGTDMADKLSLEAIVEATPAGRRTYEKAGFVAEIEEMDQDAGVEFAGRRKPVLTFLRRAKK